MNYVTGVLFSLSIAPAAIAGLIRMQKTDRKYIPFLLLVTAGLANEIASLVIMHHGYSNHINYNAYALFEALVITWQFRRTGLFRKILWLYPLLQFVFVSWAVIEFLATPLYSFSSYFIIGHSLIIVLLSISYVNRMIFEENASLWKHPFFLICTGFIVYFTYAALIEIFWILGLASSSFFRLRVYALLVYINAFVNLLFLIAILWMPMRPRYLLRYSTS